MSIYYEAVFIASLVCTLLYMFIWQKHFDVHITLVFALVPVLNLAMVFFAHATTEEAVLAAQKLSFISGLFLQLMIMLAIFSLCKIHLPRLLKTGLLLASTVVYLTALSIGNSPLFYRDVQVDFSPGGVPHLIKDYGVMHTVFRLLVVLYFLAGLAAIVYCFFRKRQVSRRILLLLFLPTIIAMFCFYGGRWLFPQIELLPVAYLIGQVFYLIISWRISVYDVYNVAVDSLSKEGETGFINFSFSGHYLGSNSAAKAVFPGLNDMTVDRINHDSELMQSCFAPWIKAFEEDNSANCMPYEMENRYYQIHLAWLYLGKRKRGYQMTIHDDTQDQEYIRLLNNYKSDLEAEVGRKTAHILEMHDNLVMSMATMVESRDNSTGGHIRRTSEGVRLLIDAIRDTGAFDLSPFFCRKLIKAAPMHDLGKIAVDDAILRKPGRFTPEEFEVMKTHAPKGARIVHEILKDTDDEVFHLIAENVAHYHHERWDGSGYPDGLSGEDIPLEARIMAVADVYDALVSKRVYKDRMSFDKAHEIIMDGMGTQFDPALKDVFLQAEPAFRAYYENLEEPVPETDWVPCQS